MKQGDRSVSVREGGTESSDVGKHPPCTRADAHTHTSNMAKWLPLPQYFEFVGFLSLLSPLATSPIGLCHILPMFSKHLLINLKGKKSRIVQESLVGK